jgi:hypothetical protein
MILGSYIAYDAGTETVTGHVTFQFDGSPVPEPGTLLLLGAGVAWLAAIRRGRVTP